MAHKKAPSSRSMWKGTISFGLVNIPVRLVPAIKEKDIRFHMLHEKDHSRLQRKMVCPVDHQEVTQKDMAKGFEIAPGQHVIIEEQELNSLAPKASRTIEIHYFTNISEINPLYYSRPYYLVPEEGAHKSYALFVEAIRQTAKAGVATFVMRNKEYVAALRVIDKLICLQTMHFTDEIIPTDQVEIETPKMKSREQELKVAVQLIESLASSFEPEKIKDEYREAVMELVEQKAEGKEVVVQPEVEVKAPKVKDLLSALEASLAEARKKKHAPTVQLHRNGRVLAHAHRN